MRILLFDWTSGGHHEFYMQAYAEALAGSHDVVAAVPEKSLDAFEQSSISILPLSDSFPNSHSGSAFKVDRASIRLHRAELSRLHFAIRDVRPDHAVHMFADRLLPALLTTRTKAPLSVLLFRPRAHYPALYGDPTSTSDRIKGFGYEAFTRAWRHSPSAHSVLTLDPDAARLWQRHGGAKAFFVPEPPVPVQPSNSNLARVGCVLFGALAERKGLRYVVDAMSRSPTNLQLKLVGHAYSDYRPVLAGEVDSLRQSGVDVELMLNRPPTHEALEQIAQCRCVLIPYVGHVGMSRVLLEAAVAGTPVIAHDRGLIGHLVRRWGLGHVVDCTNPTDFRREILGMAGDADAPRRFAPALARFAQRHSPEAFALRVGRPFDG